MEYVPCIGNSPYSFWWILLKLYRCFNDGLEICILFFQNPEIIFYHFFRIFNLDIFRALILQICIWSIYLVSATPPTVFGESFWNFTVVFRMVWRYAYCFLRILKLFFLHFNLDIFSSLNATDMYREYMPCIGNPAYSFRPILLKLYRYFAAFLWFHMRNLSLAGYNCSGGASCMACSFICVCNSKSDFIQFCFHDLIHVYNPGAGGRQPPGDKVLMSAETSCHFGHLLLVSNHRRQQFLKNPSFYLFSHTKT